MPVYDILFEMSVTICKKFPAFTPLSLKKERAAEVFELMGDLLRYMERENIRYVRELKRGKHNKNVIRVPAGDDWF